MLATREQIKFYNDDKYWNMDLKDYFMANTRNLGKETTLRSKPDQYLPLRINPTQRKS
jgi:hypothetical protein